MGNFWVVPLLLSVSHMLLSSLSLSVSLSYSLILLDLITGTAGEECNQEAARRAVCSVFSGTSSFIGPNVFLSTLSSLIQPRNFQHKNF
jgi:hypothetical protein